MKRHTRQRQAIQRVLEESGRPLLPGEVQVGAQNEVPGLGLATVYRTLKAMVADGLVQVIELPGEAPRFEIQTAHHDHFRCLACGEIFELSCPGIAAALPPGFEIADHQLVLYGKCPECSGH